MKPLISESADNDALLALGRASVQIVHDLKNQLNGLKLYATFLRKRCEKNERPLDELETIQKLIAGLDRTAADLSLIVEFGQPLELKKQPGTDLGRIVREVAASLKDSLPANGGSPDHVVLNGESGAMFGEFDPAMLANALKSISLGAMKIINSRKPEGSLQIRLKNEVHGAKKDCVIEWDVPEKFDHDPFQSFAGSHEIRLSLAARIIAAHDGSANCENGVLRVRLPLTH